MTLRLDSFWLILIIVLAECGNPQRRESKLTVAASGISHSPSIEEKTKQLVETILNLPGVLKFSKVDLIQKTYDTIYIHFTQNATVKSSFPISVKGKQLTLLHNLGSIKTEEKPCYIFTEIKIKNNDAYAYMIFDITGAIAYGNLKYTNGKWLPVKEFVTGVR